MKPCFTLTAQLAGYTLLSACSLNYYDDEYFQPRVYNSTEVTQGLAGAVAAGVVIGHLVTEPRNEKPIVHYPEARDQTGQPATSFYFESVNDTCFWLKRNQKNIREKIKVDSKYCD